MRQADVTNNCVDYDYCDEHAEEKVHHVPFPGHLPDELLLLMFGVVHNI